MDMSIPRDTEQGSVVVIMGKVVCREEELEWGGIEHGEIS